MRVNRAEFAFQKLAEGLVQSRATDFFPRFVERLATILEVDHVLIARVKEPGQAETLAVWSKGQLVGNIQYPLLGTPCETVLGYKACIYPSNGAMVISGVWKQAEGVAYPVG